jgi:5-methylcytosine-specific restriction endonuclease McrA
VSTGRNTTIRDRHRRIIARDQPPCGLCGEPIDYSLPHTDPMSFVVDHIIPRAKGGPDTLENKQAAHKAHNRAKGDSLPSNPALPHGVRFVTHRNWWDREPAR